MRERKQNRSPQCLNQRKYCLETENFDSSFTRFANLVPSHKRLNSVSVLISIPVRPVQKKNALIQSLFAVWIRLNIWCCYMLGLDPPVWCSWPNMNIVVCCWKFCWWFDDVFLRKFEKKCFDPIFVTADFKICLCGKMCPLWANDWQLINSDITSVVLKIIGP